MLGHSGQNVHGQAICLRHIDGHKVRTALHQI